MKTNLRIIIICFVLFIFNSLMAQQQQVLLIVGGDTVTKEQFIATYGKNNAIENATKQDLRDYLNLFINFKLKVNEGKEMKVILRLPFNVNCNHTGISLPNNT